MSISSMQGVGRVTSSVVDTSVASSPANTPGGPPSSTASQAGSDVSAATEAAKPLRFPWLSRLSDQLESSAPQKPSFASAPVLGDNLNKAA